MKLNALLAFFLVIFIAIIVKLSFIQIWNANAYATDYVTTNKLNPDRGKVLDRNGEPLAINETVYDVFVEPPLIQDKEVLTTKLDDILHLGMATMEARVDMTKKWARVTHGISEETKHQIEAIGMKGIGFDPVPKRYYPEASLSAHVLGFVGKDNAGMDVGYVGIEGFYNKELAGLPGLIKSEKDLVGRPIFFGTQERLDPENGRDLYLSIDKAVQNMVKKRLRAGIDKYHPKSGCAIVANPKTMEILAMTCLPDFDPTDYYDFEPTTYKNPAIADLYEPGSTFKPLVVAAGIESKSIQPDEMMDEDGPVTIGEYQVRTWDNKYEGRISMTRILEKSSNVGMVYIGDKMGNDKLFEFIQKFGFGSPTGIDLEGEESGYLKERDKWYPIDYATATFGQGIAVTEIQMLTALSAVVNGGHLMRPYIVYKTVNGTQVRMREVKEVRRVISDKTSADLRKMMVSVVDHGEVHWDKPKGYVIGGKTGTAQIALAGKYDASKTNASFIGFAPADDPKFIALIVLKEPQASEWGSETAAPIFFDIAKDLLAYYNIPPSN